MHDPSLVWKNWENLCRKNYESRQLPTKNWSETAATQSGMMRSVK
jgi:hypothetical protein